MAVGHYLLKQYLIAIILIQCFNQSILISTDNLSVTDNSTNKIERQSRQASSFGYNNYFHHHHPHSHNNHHLNLNHYSSINNGRNNSSFPTSIYRPGRCYPNNCLNDGQCIINPNTHKSFCR